MFEEPEAEPPPAPSPASIPGQEILQACLRSGEAFDQAMKAGDPLIMEALAAFQPLPVQAAAQAEPMDRDPQIQQALDRFRCLWENRPPSAP